MRYKIEGMKELEKTIKKLGQLPQKSVTKAAKKGAIIALREVRNRAPIDTGELRKGIVIKGERVKLKGKKVYQVTFDCAKNDIFVKMSADKKKRYYYPASQEYGFSKRNGGSVQGLHFMKESIESNYQKIQKEIVDTMLKLIDMLK